jgi:hypothetical protein
MNQLIHCKTCDEVFMKTPFDGSPVYDIATERSLENYRWVETDDYQDFMIHHQGHQLEHLKIIEDSFVSEKDYSEPVKTCFFKATNGKEKFVIKKFRERIDEPLKYQLISGDYSLKCTAIEIQSDQISKQLKAEIKPPLSQGNIDAFLKLYRAIAENVEIKDLERIPEESQCPLEIYYRLDDIRLMYLLRNCRNIFKGQEYSAIEEFIYRQKDDGVLLLKATYKIRLTEIVKPGKKRIPAPFVSKKEKIAAR